MRAFVTGGTGFVGGHLVQALCARGDAVTCLVRSPQRAAALG
ncbi:MAG TPA: SDR family oxidoreductase, partial [Candidatus Dormibacteraeota bacterium]|nr:SDR family oxidoreductase [Candidatus Dormibacteraeota bacterium]